MTAVLNEQLLFCNHSDDFDNFSVFASNNINYT